LLSLNRKTDYALVALAGLCAADQRLSARDLAGRLQLPLPVLRNILKVLTQRGVLRSEQGSRGGYRLARPAAQISVAEIVDVIEGRPRLARCCDQEGAGDCELVDDCPIVRPMQRVHGLMTGLLERVSVADLVGNTVPTSVGVGTVGDGQSASAGSRSE
jgi:Rrf2 family protein